MQNNIHIKSLQSTLQEKTAKIKKLKKHLVIMVIILCILLVTFLLQHNTQVKIILTITVASYAIITTIKIYLIQQIQKKIQQKIKSL
ncbi:hypothetical protein LPB03_14670 [Polaribacter vadi]|uniref:Uncharacterized protein n=1 Tax=Polaribacter vadi TaxID=1774273 RepID=A0A1B8TR18_9FLAO|nr:hypothetical protein LPB03_14670 [Polaribacter vadi]OBY62014.1 hypothetical protein LPB3_14635 [Polaribacter vadi]